jgi:hypothetical protein
MNHRTLLGLALLSVVSANCGGGSSATAPDTTVTTTPPTTTPGGGASLRMYSSTSPTGPWTLTTVTVTGSDAPGLVDPSPILMPDGSILLYYLMSYQTSGDPAASQPGNLWKMGVAKSTDNGLTFAHQGVAYTFDRSTTDPFPMVIDTAGTIRLLASQGQNVPSVTATDTTGLHFAAAQDQGLRTTTGGVPGALKIGGTYYIYGCGQTGIGYYSSTDGLNFAFGGTAIAPTVGTTCDPSPIDAGGGTYLMAFKRGGSTGPASDSTYMATSTDGKTWTELGLVGAGSVPGLVKDKNGVLHIYAVGF